MDVRATAAAITVGLAVTACAEPTPLVDSGTMDEATDTAGDPAGATVVVDGTTIVIPSHLLPGRVEVAASSTHRLGVGSSITYAAGVRDLCDDEAAIEAGLDGGELATNRDTMGVDCASAAALNRFLFLYPNGANVLLSAADLASFDPVRDAPRGDGDQPPDRIEDVAPMPMGSYAWGEQLSAAAIDGELSVAVTTVGDDIVAVVHNRTDQFAYDVVVSIGATTTALPLTLQPGEWFPVALEATQPGAPTVSADLRDAPDPRRALLFEPTASGAILSYEPPTTHDLEMPPSLDGVRVLVAELRGGAITELRLVPPTLDGADTAGLALFDFTTVTYDTGDTDGGIFLAWAEEA